MEFYDQSDIEEVEQYTVARYEKQLADLKHKVHKLHKNINEYMVLRDKMESAIIKMAELLMDEYVKDNFPRNMSKEKREKIERIKIQLSQIPRIAKVSPLGEMQEKDSSLSCESDIER